MTQGNRLYQRVDSLAQGVSYLSFIHVKSQTGTGSITRKIIPFDSNGAEMSSQIIQDTIQVSTLYSSIDLGIFKRVDFPNYIVSEDVDYVIYEISVFSSDLIIDALSFEASTEGENVISSQFFKPVEIIPSGASSCSKC